MEHHCERHPSESILHYSSEESYHQEMGPQPQVHGCSHARRIFFFFFFPFFSIFFPLLFFPPFWLSFSFFCFMSRCTVIIDGMKETYPYSGGEGCRDEKGVHQAGQKEGEDGCKKRKENGKKNGRERVYRWSHGIDSLCRLQLRRYGCLSFLQESCSHLIVCLFPLSSFLIFLSLYFLSLFSFFLLLLLFSFFTFSLYLSFLFVFLLFVFVLYLRLCLGGECHLGERQRETRGRFNEVGLLITLSKFSKLPKIKFKFLLWANFMFIKINKPFCSLKLLI